MFNFIRGIFNKQESKPAEIKIGSLWVFVKDWDDPFPSRYKPIKVVDVKQGWVLYDMSSSKNERLPIESFIDYYKPVE